MLFEIFIIKTPLKIIHYAVYSYYINYFTGVDYDSGPYNVLFHAEETSVIFNVSINDDDLLEDEETFNLTITSSSLPRGIFINNPAQVTVTIMDDEGNYITLILYCNILM